MFSKKKILDLSKQLNKLELNSNQENKKISAFIE